ncbi:MAG: hypothetical protein V1800_09315 [Candidatus Latescibacterota bacterium]
MRNAVGAYMAAAQRGAEWLISQQAEDGSLWKHKGLDSCFKAAWALTATGHLTEASRLLSWAKAHAMPRPGDFYLPEETQDEKDWRFYRNCFFLIGAQKSGRFDVASAAAIGRMLEYQHPCGGFLGNRDESPSRFLDPLLTCLGGWTCLHTGQDAAAIRAAEFLLYVMEIQPEIATRFYILWDPEAGTLVTEFPADESISYTCELHRAQQHFFYVGAPMGYLSDVYKRTGEQRFLDGAWRYFDFESRTNPEGFSWPSKCKSGWGAALLYSVTGDTSARKMAEQVASQTLLAAQEADGGWSTFHYPTRDDSGTSIEISRAELTAEFVFELTEIARSLA